MKLWEAMDEVTPRIWEETQRSTSPSIQFQTAPQISNCSKLCFLRLKIQKKLNQGISWVWKDLVSLQVLTLRWWILLANTLSLIWYSLPPFIMIRILSTSASFTPWLMLKWVAPEEWESRKAFIPSLPLSQAGCRVRLRNSTIFYSILGSALPFSLL